MSAQASHREPSKAKHPISVVVSWRSFDRGQRLQRPRRERQLRCFPLAPVGRLDPAAADQLGVDAVTLLAVRPDRHLGFRSDAADLAALLDYEARVRGLSG
jgi:hypothetical protein